jgi:hypothetical protein
MTDTIANEAQIACRDRADLGMEERRGRLAQLTPTPG